MRKKEQTSGKQKDFSYFSLSGMQWLFPFLLVLFVFAFPAEINAQSQPATNTQPKIAERKLPKIVAGKVRDLEDGSPVAFAAITILERGEVVSGTYSDEQGNFALMIPEGKSQALHLKIQYLNSTAERMIPRKTVKLMVVINTGWEMPTVTIFSKQFQDEHGNEIANRVLVGEEEDEGLLPYPWHCSCRSITYRIFSSRYRIRDEGIKDLNDFIQLRSSEMYYQEGVMR